MKLRLVDGITWLRLLLLPVIWHKRCQMGRNCAKDSAGAPHLMKR
jgi:hypothetical protein